MLSLCFSFMMKTAGYSLSHAMLQALYFSEESYEESQQQKAREGDKIQHFH